MWGINKASFAAISHKTVLLALETTQNV